MKYVKQTFLNGEVLTADNLNHIEDGIMGRQEIPNEILDNHFICAYGGIKRSGYVQNKTGIHGATTFIHCGDADEITVRMMIETSNNGYGLAFYDEDRNVIEFIPNLVGLSLSSELRTIKVPTNAVYFRTTYFSFSNLGEQENFYAFIPHKGEYYLDGKKAYQEGHINYSVFVNQTVANVVEETDTCQDISDYKSSTCVLFLPKSYKQLGKPTPSVVLCMGAGGFLMMENFRENPTGWMRFIEMLNEAGYAVIGCNGAYDNAGVAVKPSGAPQAVQAHHFAFQWAKKHYNLTETTNYCGGSMGGLIAMNAPILFPNEVQTVLMMAGMIDTYNQGFNRQDTNARKQISKLYGFTGTTYDATIVGGCDPMKRIITVNNVDYVFGTFPPTKMWHGLQDTTLPEYKQNKKYVNAMKNSGLIADMRMINNCPHDLARGVFEYNGAFHDFAAKEMISWLNRFNY